MPRGLSLMLTVPTEKPNARRQAGFPSESSTRREELEADDAGED